MAQLNSAKGQALIEVIIAASGAVVILVAAIGAILVTSANSQFARIKSQAVLYTSQSIEEVRAIRAQKGWAVFKSYLGNCLIRKNISDWSLNCSPGGSDTIGTFSRTINLSDAASGVNPDDVKLVIVTLSFTDQKGVHNVQLKANLAKY